MIVNDTQMAVLSVQLSALGQADLSDNSDDVLSTLRFLLKQAYDNVVRTEDAKNGISGDCISPEDQEEMFSNYDSPHYEIGVVWDEERMSMKFVRKPL